ncbi:MAG: YcxB family protein [Sedimentisphaerales bacterium]|nr:YcxB family protein [Sedimentisphaerales bacterium]
MVNLQIEINTDLRDLNKIMLWGLSRSWLLALYSFAILLYGVYKATSKWGEYTEGDYQELVLIIILLLAAPVIVGLGRTRRLWKKTEREGKREVFFESEGVRSKTELTEVFHSWKKFTKISETKEYIVGLQEKTPIFILCKNRLSSEILTALRKVLRESPVSSIQLLDE